MKAITRTLLLPAALCLLWQTMAPASAQIAPEFKNPKIHVYQHDSDDGGYWTTTLADPDNADPSKRVEHPIGPELMELRRRLMARHVLEDYVEFLSPVRFPVTFRAFASGCSGAPLDSAYYDGGSHRWMNVCYSYLAFLEKAADFLVENQERLKLWTPVSKEQLVAGMFTAVLLHETGHALFDTLGVPVFGREEDAADQMAIFLAMQFDPQTARTIVKGRAYYWAYGALIRKDDPGSVAMNTFDPNLPNDPDVRCGLDPFCAFADTHGTASQRMYNTLCLAYGGNHAAFQDLVDAHWLPAERLKSCDDEYARARLAFAKTIYPFIDQAQMAKVKARQWFQARETQEK